MKVPYVIVIGSKEIESGQVTPRIRQDLTEIPAPTLAYGDFYLRLAKITEKRTLKSSL